MPFDSTVRPKSFVEVFMSSDRSSDSTNLPLIVGVTGSMDLRAGEISALKEGVRQILHFLKYGQAGHPQAKKSRAFQISRFLRRRRAGAPHVFEELLAMMPQGRTAKDGRILPRPFEEAFASWEGMPYTDILVLSSLAPGADSLVAEVALETNYCTVRAPLPFPPDIYEKADRFVRTEAGATASPPTREDDGRQQHYRDLVPRVQEAFAVRLQGEHEPPTSEQYEAGRKDEKKRRERYYVAGEYIARHAHLLLAVWDHECDTDPEAVPAAVVAARQRGPRRGVLDGDIGVGLPPGGPTLHLYTRSRNNPNAPQDPPPFRLRVLLPEPLPGEDEPRQRADREVKEPDLPGRIAHKLRRVLRLEPPPGEDEARERNEQEVDALNLFARIVRNLDKFNAALDASKSDGKEEMEKRFRHQGVREELKDKWPDIDTAFRNLARLRRVAADCGRELEVKHTNTLFVLFWLTFLAASSFHFCAHWHTAEAGHTHGPWEVQVRFGYAALLLTVLSIGWYGWRKSKRYAERGNDYRALAEGLRVQFHWNLAGLGSSVPANYMHRQRSELEWIRGAIRAASFPYHRFRDWFAQLSPATQHAALSECLQPGWIEDQRKYFKGNTEKNHRLLHFFHKLAGWLALTGILTLAGVIAGMASHPESWSVWLIPGALVVLTGWWGVGWLFHHGRREYEPKPETKTTWDHFLWRLIWLVDRITPARESPPSPPRGDWRLLWGLVRNFFLLLIPSAAAAVLLLAVVHRPRWFDAVPSPENAAIIVGGILLLGGALLVAWAEKALYSELAYQYGTMMTLFQCAELQLTQACADLKALDPKSGEYRRKLREIQDFLFALGKEALDENAEWLILHRARPLEPVMAG
jgi:hypothetical protein